jgi:hypothetical protein
MRKSSSIFIVFVLIATISCDNTTGPNLSTRYVTASITSSETYEYETGTSGDEDGAYIKVQAEHFVTSEIVRNAETNWAAVYIYEPEPLFSGTDYVELELSTGSDGASPPTNIETVKITIHVD